MCTYVAKSKCIQLQPSALERYDFNTKQISGYLQNKSQSAAVRTPACFTASSQKMPLVLISKELDYTLLLIMSFDPKFLIPYWGCALTFCSLYYSAVTMPEQKLADDMNKNGKQHLGLFFFFFVPFTWQHRFGLLMYIISRQKDIKIRKWFV